MARPSRIGLYRCSDGVRRVVWRSPFTGLLYVTIARRTELRGISAYGDLEKKKGVVTFKITKRAQVVARRAVRRAYERVIQRLAHDARGQFDADL
jgi:hypothetical protein